MLRGEQLPQI